MSDPAKQEPAPTIDATSATVQEMFGKILHDRIQSGALEAAVTESVDKLIADSAESCLRSYGEVGKAIKEKLSAAIMPKLEEIGDLPRYHEFVVSRMKDAAQKFYDERLGDALDKEMEELMGEVPEKASLEWLVRQLLEEAEDEDEPESEITLIIEETNYRSTHIYLDKEPDKAKYQCAYHLHLSETRGDEDDGFEILSLTLDGDSNIEAELKSRRPRFGRLYRFEKVLYNIFVLKQKFYLESTDPDDYETSWSVY